MKMNLTTYRTDIIPVYETSLGTKVVDARELHAYLGIGKEYANWVKSVIKKHNLSLNEHYVAITPAEIQIDGVIAKSGKNPKGGRTRKEYIFKLENAKKIAMGTNNAKGDEVKEYFLECERVAKGIVMPPAGLMDHTRRDFQVNNSKAVASHFFKQDDLQAAAQYYRQSCKSISGKEPSQLKKEAKANRMPSKQRTSGREVLRHTNPSAACALSLCDTMVKGGVEINQAIPVAKKSQSLYNDLLQLGIIPKELAA